ncbi:phosphatidylserine synthase [Aquimarina sp. AD10]|uniref:Phosphatidylserine synthase n=1 Tax=Aquimarina aggregata TaxID=1642818 RepID=A0A162WV44_9FLAO|nr:MULTISPECIES: CDP-alcohol phosphatidyltransferase family protein [Aquimarina]AXT60650.1 phosphatidylserine synthase [Aquimarina sp. AD10]KZS38293.1 phosphatidylserine synthase [Aquimarina aggregata]RKN01742.1 phosphatidylserine synthase [Aquimarina sp. AD10]
MWIKKQIPNLITLLNLLCGCIAVIFGVHGNLELTAFFVMLGIGFDFFDGFAARILNAQSELGLQLDSLADMVTSGVAPGIVMYQLLSQVFGKPFYAVPQGWDTNEIVMSLDWSYLSLLGLLVTLASAYRLANFNIDTRQTSSFIGLPTPANTLLIVSLPLILKYQQEIWVVELILNKWFLIALTVVSCYLLNAEIPLFALKFKTWGLKGNKVRYIFLLCTIVMILLFKFAAIPLILLLYVLMSLVFKKESSN